MDYDTGINISTYPDCMVYFYQHLYGLPTSECDFKRFNSIGGKMKGIKKLKMGLMIILIMEAMSIAIGFVSSSLSDMEAADFTKGLSYSEQNQIDQVALLYSDYPDYNSYTVLTLAGVLLWLAISMTSFLLYKVWKLEKIE
jgi:hypothetical protein